MTDFSLPTGPVLGGGLLSADAPLDRLLATRPRDAKEALRAAHDFESILLHRLLEEMRRTIPKAGLIDSGTSDQIDGLFWMYLAKHMADQGGIGLWKSLADQMTRVTADGETKPNLEVEA